MKIKLLLPAACFFTCFSSIVFSQTKIHHKNIAETNSSTPYFNTNFKIGDKFTDVYSRDITYQGDDFTELVNRISGTSSYVVTDGNPQNPQFDCVDYYDGRKPIPGKFGFSPDGKMTYNGKQYVYSSASGLMYNQLIWGIPPSIIHDGDSWTVKIPQAWELGPAGDQTVKVISVDAKHHTVMLEREGSGDGFFDSDAKQISVTNKEGKKLKVNVKPGTAHWHGYTMVKNGLIISDELMVTRPLTLSNDSVSYKAQQREYVLLSLMPAES